MGGENIERESSTTVSVRVYNPDKPGGRLEQVNRFVNNMENSSLIESTYPLEYQNHNLTGEVILGIKKGVTVVDASLLIEQCGSISQYPCVHFNSSESYNYIVAIVYEPTLKYPNSTADAEMYPSLRNFMMLIDSSPLIRYVEPNAFLDIDLGPVS